MPRPTASDIRWDVPVAEPRLTARTWRTADRQTAKHLRDIDTCLRPAAGAGKCWERIDYLLDERLFLRSPDAMDTWPARGQQ